MKIGLFMVFIMIISACGSSSQNDQGKILQHGTDKVNKAALACSPDTLYWGDTLTITMSVPHERYLAIIDPDVIFHYIVWWQTEPRSGNEQISLLDPKEFRNLKELKIVTNATKASTRYHGKKENELIFSKPGVYTVMLADRLGVDDPENQVYKYPIYYKGKK